MRQVVDALGVKQVAFDLDVAPSHLVNALEERDRNVPLKWLPYILVNAPAHLGDEILIRLARLRGRDVVEAAPPDPAAELEMLKAALGEELGPTARAAILQKAAGMARGRRPPSNGSRR